MGCYPTRNFMKLALASSRIDRFVFVRTRPDSLGSGYTPWQSLGVSPNLIKSWELYRLLETKEKCYVIHNCSSINRSVGAGLWGFSYTMGGFIHILLVLAIIMVLVNLLSGRKAV